MKRLSIYYTETRASVTVENGVTRETSAATMAEALAAMHEADRLVFVRFCRAVVSCAEGEDAQDRQAGAAALVEMTGGRR